MNTRKTGVTVLVALAALLAAAGRGAADEVSDRVQGRMLHATAWVVGNKSHGTGAVIDRKDRLLVTSYHVVGTEERVSVVFPVLTSGRLFGDRAYYWKNWSQLSLPGRVVWRDAERDLALVRVAGLPRSVEALPLAGQSSAVGRRVYRLGSPAADGEAWVLRTGLVKHVGQRRTYYEKQEQTLDARMFASDMEVRPGNSGSPVVNENGELVGVVTGFDFRDGGGKSGVAIDVEELRDALRELRTLEAPSHAKTRGQPGDEPGAGKDIDEQDDPAVRKPDPSVPGKRVTEKSGPKGRTQPGVFKSFKVS